MIDVLMLVLGLLALPHLTAQVLLRALRRYFDAFFFSVLFRDRF